MRMILLLLVFGYMIYCGFGSLMDSRLNPSAPYHTVIAALGFFSLWGYAIFQAIISPSRKERLLTAPVFTAGVLLTLLWLGSKDLLRFTALTTSLLIGLLWVSVLATASLLLSRWFLPFPRKGRQPMASVRFHHIVERLSTLLQRLLS